MKFKLDKSGAVIMNGKECVPYEHVGSLFWNEKLYQIGDLLEQTCRVRREGWLVEKGGLITILGFIGLSLKVELSFPEITFILDSSDLKYFIHHGEE